MLIFKKHYSFLNYRAIWLCSASGLTLKILCSVTCVLFTTYLPAQSPAYYVQHFNSENGMQNSIKGIEADKQGYLWFATEQGLVRYDGTNFKLYNRSNSPQLKSDRLISIGLTNDSNIYAQAEDKNCFYFEDNS